MPLYDGISRKGLQEVAIAALIRANTMAGERVFEPRDWPTRPELFPVLLVQTPMESKTSQFPGLLQFDTVIHLVVVGRVVGKSAEAVNQQLDVFSGQVEEALMLDPEFSRAIQQILSIETRITVSAESKNQIGEFGVTFEVQVYQAFGADGEPLESTLVTMAQPAAPLAEPIVLDLKFNGVLSYVRQAWNWLGR
jgi:hypothetical protein